MRRSARPESRQDNERGNSLPASPVERSFPSQRQVREFGWNEDAGAFSPSTEFQQKTIDLDAVRLPDIIREWEESVGPQRVQFVCLGTGYSREEVRCLQLTNGTHVYRAGQSKVQWQADGRKESVIVRPFRVPLSRTRNTHGECWSTPSVSITATEPTWRWLLAREFPAA